MHVRDVGSEYFKLVGGMVMKNEDLQHYELERIEILLGRSSDKEALKR